MTKAVPEWFKDPIEFKWPHDRWLDGDDYDWGIEWLEENLEERIYAFDVDDVRAMIEQVNAKVKDAA